MDVIAKAFEAFPKQLRTTFYGGTTCIDDETYKAKREGFVVGYKKAVDDVTDIITERLSKTCGREGSEWVKKIKLKYLK